MALQVRVTRRGPGIFSLRAAGSSARQEVLVHTHTLRDGGLLVQLDGTSHVVYAEEETAGTRLLIDGRTCLLQVGPLAALAPVGLPQACALLSRLV